LIAKTKSKKGEDDVTDSQKSSVWPTLFASSVGTIFEWYDFIIYGTAAALVFNKIFFPQFDAVAGVMASLGVYSIGFLIRPLGGVLFGNLGDRFGRKPVLIATLTLMGIATTLIGLLPTYASIGLWAPAMLVFLRMMQGLGAGAEFGGALLMAAEVDPNRRGLNASIPAASVDVAGLFATGMIALFAMLPEDDFLSWGWRIPFVLGLPLLLVGLYIRRKVPESREFEASADRPKTAPVVELFRSQRARVFTAMAVNLAPSLSYIFQVFSLTYITTYLHLPRQVGLTGVLIAGAASIFICLGVGMLTDRFGSRPLIAIGAALTALFAFPFFWLLDTKNTYLIWIAIFIAQAIANRMMFAAQPVFYTSLFPVRLRYSGIAIAREVTFAIIGGPLPLVATGLIAYTSGATWPVAAIICVMGLITLVAVLRAPPPIAEGVS
jgi:MFS transporter, MHS family, shikimate and dehydroshikimate transport protein